MNVTRIFPELGKQIPNVFTCFMKATVVKYTTEILSAIKKRKIRYDAGKFASTWASIYTKVHLAVWHGGAMISVWFAN